MPEKSIGEVIRKKRVELKLTQEELADEICSVGYLSKIENGIREPSSRIVRMLLERLGATQDIGFKSGNQVADFRHNVIRMEIMRAIENQNVYEVEEKLWIMKQLLNSEDVDDLQFYEMSDLIFRVMCGLKIDDFEMQCYRIWLMSRREEDFTNGVCASGLNRTEMWILSNIATGFAWKNHFELASKLYLHIYCTIQNNEDLNRTMNKAKAIMCNNIAVC
ncbi:MAG: helix-turn-helix transcriptional regulator, partial [Lachnospiraceae bacterium]|nr:helix-turn-helix transcriptional regulator [Lachnospiraceae bacterium]